ncbi:hypothetical protein VaNZ11_010825, partial [Volvox africanus]
VRCWVLQQFTFISHWSSPCTYCQRSCPIFGVQHVVPFRGGQWPNSLLVELLTGSLHQSQWTCGTAGMDTLTWVILRAFTPTKEAVKDKVVTMVNQLWTYSGFRVKEVRSDRGGEFINSPLQEFFRTKGIRHGPTVGYAPEQNGAAERLNRTLLEKIRALLAESQLP